MDQKLFSYLLCQQMIWWWLGVTHIWHVCRSLICKLRALITINMYVVSTCTMYECMETLCIGKYFSSVDNIFVTCWHNYRMRTLQSNQIICNIVNAANIQVFVGNDPLNMTLICHLSFKTLGLYHSQEPGHKL